MGCDNVAVIRLGGSGVTALLETAPGLSGSGSSQVALGKVVFATADVVGFSKPAAHVLVVLLRQSCHHTVPLGWLHCKQVPGRALSESCRAGWGMLCYPRPPVLSKVGWVEAHNGDMTMLHAWSQASGPNMQATWPMTGT